MNLLVTVLIFIAQVLEIERFKHPYLPLLPPQFLNFSFKTAKSTAECLQQMMSYASCHLWKYGLVLFATDASCFYEMNK